MSLRSPLVFVFFMWLASIIVSCGGGSQPVDVTVATLEPIRGALNVEGVGEILSLSRLGPGQEIQANDVALGRLRLDGGPRMLIGPSGQVRVIDTHEIGIGGGQVFVQVDGSDTVSVQLGQGTLRAGDAAFSVEANEAGGVVYVVRGEVSYLVGERRGVAHAGVELTISGETSQVEPAVLWTDWTGGLARPGLGDITGPEGVGSLEARVPDETGQARWPLVARRLDVRVQVQGDYAVTEVDQVFFNPASETVEGIYRFRVPKEAVLQRFAVDRNGRLVDGYVRERAQAQRAYEAQVYRGSTDDPALLVWDAPGSYRARIYPIGAGETRRIVIRYAEWLQRRTSDAPRLYRYPMGGGGRPPHIQEFSLVVDIGDAEVGDVRAGMEASVDDERVMLRQSDFEPRADFWLELIDEASPSEVRGYRGQHRPPQRAPGSRAIPNEADERDYFYLPIVLPTTLGQAGEATGPRPLDLVIVADISAGTDRSRLELGRSVVESLVSHLRTDDRVAIVTSDLTIRAVTEESAPELGPATAERIEALLDGLARVPPGGATDLGAAIAAAAELLDPARSGAVVYVGDGAPTVGELGAEGLLRRMDRLPNPVRLYGVAVGAQANIDLLAALTRGGGLALRVEDRSAAAEAALRVLAHAGRPLAQRVTVDVGAGIDNAFPRGPVDVVLGEVLSVVGRVRGTPPTTVTVTGTIAGQEFTEELRVSTITSEDPTDLRLRWAGERLRQLLLEGAGREAVAELGTRCGLITPYTSYYVPSARELRQSGHSQLLLDRPLLLAARSPQRFSKLARGAMTAALVKTAGPLSFVTGCWATGDEPAVATQAEEIEDWVNSPGMSDDEQGGRGKRHKGEEGQMGRQDAAKSDNRYGIKGPADNPQMARERSKEYAESGGILAALQDNDGRYQNRAQAAAPEPEPSEEENGERDRSEVAASTVTRGAPAKSASSNEAVPVTGVARGEDATGMDDGYEGSASPFGADSAQGADPENALGALMGNQIGDNFGYGGLGTKGTGRGGGGTGEGTIGLGSLSTIGHGGGGGSGSGYGRSSGGLRGRRASVPTIRTGTAEVRGTLSKEVIRRYIRRHINQIRYCYEQQLARESDLAGRVAVRFVISPSGAVSSSAVASSTIGNQATESCVARAVQRIAFPQPEGGGVVIVTYPFMFQSSGSGGSSAPASSKVAAAEPEPQPVNQARVSKAVSRWDQGSHMPRRCSDAAGQPLGDRRSLWVERLGSAGGVSGWLRVYRNAIHRCEAPTWRDRRTLLGQIMNQAGSVSRMIQVHRTLQSQSAREYLREVIFTRVRTPDDLRQVREYFGVNAEVDWALVEQLLSRANTLDARIRLLRQLLGLYPRGELTVLYPNSFELRLRLLSALEEGGRLPEARRLAHDLRTDPLADASIRTAVGEMYLRHDDIPEARRVFSEIVEFAPYDAAARRRLGDLYRAHGWYEDAYRQYQTLAEIRPDDTSVSLLLAQAAAGAGRVDEAIRLEQRLAETAEPGAASGLARVAILWSSVRFAKLRKTAREADDTDRVRALLSRMRRTGILREAGELRVSLTWSHPDSGLSLWVGHPGAGLTRPTDISPEFGLEAFDLERVESGAYSLEVRRQGQDLRTPVDAELVIVWNEGQPDERIEIRQLRFEGDDMRAQAWTLEGDTLSDVEPAREVRR